MIEKLIPALDFNKYDKNTGHCVTEEKLESESLKLYLCQTPFSLKFRQ